MNRSGRTGVLVGFLLVLIGGWLLLVQFVPGLEAWIDFTFAWPMIIIFVAVGLLLLGLLVNAPGMAVPAFIVGGIGGLLYWQNATGNWSSWSYVWTLIPGFVGLGVIVSGFLEGNLRSALSGGGWLIIISLLMFFMFGSFFGELGLLGDYWPVLVIILGGWLLIRPLLRRRTQ